MATIYDGHGITLTKGSVTFDVQSISIPGWKRAEYEVTTLGNTAVKTKKAGLLKEWGNVVVTCLYDPSKFVNLAITNESTVIDLGTPTITFWSEVVEVGEVKMEEDKLATIDITLLVTNLNATNVETAPVLA